MNNARAYLHRRVADGLAHDIRPEVIAFAERLAHQAGAEAVLFYGSNLRTGSLDGVLDFYLLMPGRQSERVWPRVAYHEWQSGDMTLRAKTAAMSLDMFKKACRGRTLDTTIWTRFVQPSALAWSRTARTSDKVGAAIADAVLTATGLACALGPARGTPEAYWRALFRATYKAELRVEKAGREDTILSANQDHFNGLLQLGWNAQGIAFDQAPKGELIPEMTSGNRRRWRNWWRQRRRLGKPLNLLRLAKATTTFEGAPHYAAWKIERHTGLRLEVTPFREKHPLLAAPGVLMALRRHKRWH